MLFLLFERYEQQHYELLCTSFSLVVFLVLEYIPSRGLLSCMVTLCIIFWVIAIFHESIIWSHHNTEEPPPQIWVQWISQAATCEVLVVQLCLTLRPHGLQPTRLLCPWDFPGKDTGVGCHFLLQGIFLTQGQNPGLLHCRHSLPTELWGKPLAAIDIF